MLSSVEVERKVFPIIKQCLDGMEQAASSINEKEASIEFSFCILQIKRKDIRNGISKHFKAKFFYGNYNITWHIA